MTGPGRSSTEVNVSPRERAVHLLIALALFWLGITGWLDEGLSGALRVASLLPLLIAATGWSPFAVFTRRPRQPLDPPTKP